MADSEKKTLHFNERGGLMDKTLGLDAGRSGVRILGRGKFSLRSLAVDARVKYPLLPFLNFINKIL